ncbi:MAG TPA: aminotransferase class I/II-fold pyridoxal phosphate-dependent enzyme, partial [Lysobacter sp.]
MSVLDLVRSDLRGFAGYSSARTESLQGDIWLNANESAWANPADGSGSSRRYPDPQPQELRERLAQLYGCDASQLLIGRGSDEAIDLLVRALCEPGRDAVVVTPPVFGMYAVCARLQNAVCIDVPLVGGEAEFAPD